MFKIMEYMSLGKPIVVFDLPEHRFTAQHAAIYVPPNDEREFARALSGLMDDARRRQRLGAYGRRRMKAQLAWDYSVPQLLDAYRLVLPRAAESNRRASQGAKIKVQAQSSPFAETPGYKSSD